MNKITITRTVLGWLDGTGLFQQHYQPTYRYSNDDATEAAARVMRQTIVDAPTKKNGSVTVLLDDAATRVLYDMADWMGDTARDSAGYDAWARGELKASRSLLEQIERVAPQIAQAHRDEWRALVARAGR